MLNKAYCRGMGLPIRYRTAREDSARWDGFEFRPGDIVISARSRSGTTWMQMICALLIFQDPEPPAPLSELSPWLDWQTTPRAEVIAALHAQRHRRFVKTHTPLDGLPSDPSVTYVVVARHPLDAAVSLYHHYANLDVRRLSLLQGLPAPDPATPPLPLREWLLSWIGQDARPQERPDCLAGYIHHAADAWSRRDAPSVVLAHYADLTADLPGEMSRLAGRLGIMVPASRWPALVSAATFPHMRARASRLTQRPPGILIDDAEFFRQGRSGAGRDTLSAAELVAYHARVASAASADAMAWLHR
jgi:aryl sulfotransferase